MPNISITTLLMSIQAVKHEIVRLKQLLTSETLQNIEDVEELLLAYGYAEAELKELYIREQKTTSSHPDYDSL